MPQTSSKDNNTQGQLNPSKIVSDSISNFAGILIPLFVALATVPLAIKGLGEERYGLLSIVWVILTYLSLLDFGVSKASSKYLAEFHGKDDHPQATEILRAANIFALLSGTLVGGVMMLSTPWIVGSLRLSSPDGIQEATNSLLIISVALPLLFLGTGLRGAMEASRRFHSVNLGLVITNSISYAIPAISFFMEVSLTDLIFWVVAVRALSVFYYAILVMRTYHVSNLFGIRVGREIKKLLKYGSWITLTSLISPLLVYMDRILIGTLMPLANVAYYSVPYDLVNRIRIFPQALLKTLFPEFSQMHTENRMAETRTLIENSFRSIVLMVGIVGLLLSFYALDILTFWLGSEIAGKSAAVMTIFGVGFSLNAVAFIPFNFLQSIGRPDIPAKLHLIEFPFYILLLFLLTNAYGILGTAAAWLLRVTADAILNTMYMMFQLKPEFEATPFKWPKKELVILIGFALFQTTIQFIELNIFIKLILVLISILVSLVIIWQISFTPEERKRVKIIFRIG